MSLPLADVRILAVEQFGAGPWGTLQLADLGAEIVKLEDPTSAGDVGRYVPPFQEGEDSLFFETFNRGKKSISLDLRHPAAARGAARPRAGLRRRVLEPPWRPAAQARADLRAAARCQSTRRLLLALRLRDDRPPRLRGRLRLHDAGPRGLAEPDRRAWRTADQERPLPRRPLGRLRVGDRAPRGDLARPPGGRRVRLRRLAVRDRPARARVHRSVGRDARLRAAAPAQLGASDDRAVPELRGLRRVVRGRLPRSRSSGSGSAT